MPQIYSIQSIDMDSEEVLKILLEIHDKPGMTQRELSSRLGISLGKTNYLLKALIHKGFIKADNFKNAENKTRYIYLLTPKGMEKKARATYRFLKRKKQEYERLEEEIRRLSQELEQNGKSGINK
jgi:EPS-associated MarR family transcriptional regulator